MRVHPLQLAPRWALAALLALACVEVPQQAPFTTSDFTVADFNTTAAKVPFPILLPCASTDPVTNACLSGGTFACAGGDCAAGGRVALPINRCADGQTPCLSAGNPAGCVACDSSTGAQLKQGLNTLDGFSTYGSLRTTFNNGLNRATVSKQNAFLLDAATGAVADFSPKAATVDGVETLIFAPEVPDSGTVAEPKRPLRPEATYLAVVTRGIQDSMARPIEADRTFAFLRARSALANTDGTALAGSLLGNATAATFGCNQTTAAGQQACVNATRATLERLRQSFNVIFTGLESSPRPIQRENIALLWTIRTMSTAKAFLGLRQVLAAVAPAFTAPPQLQVPGVAFYCANPAAPTDATCRLPVAQIKVAAFQMGCTRTANFLTPTGTFGVGPTGVPVFKPDFIPYIQAIPAGDAPATGWPVAIFGHGLTRWRYDMIAIANTLATFGIATVAIDHAFHGWRANAVLGAEVDDSGAACTAALGVRLGTRQEPAAEAPVLCRDPSATRTVTAGTDGGAATVTCSGTDGGAGETVRSGQRFFTSNLFATRDAGRQSVLDLMQLVRTLKTATTATGAPTFDVTKISYVGQSLGSIIGAGFTAVEPDVKVSVLNVPVGGLANWVEQTKNLDFCKVVFEPLAQLGICQRTDAVNAPCACSQTGAYLQFMHTFQWILDAGDPINFGRYLIDSPLYCAGPSGPVPCAAAPGATPLKKRVLVQRMEDDQTVPNSTTNALRAAIGASSCYREFTGGSHGFLLSPGTTAATAALTQRGQLEVASFLASGGATTKLPALGGGAADACPVP